MHIVKLYNLGVYSRWAIHYALNIVSLFFQIIVTPYDTCLCMYVNMHAHITHNTYAHTYIHIVHDKCSLLSNVSEMWSKMFTAVFKFIDHCMTKTIKSVDSNLVKTTRRYLCPPILVIYPSSLILEKSMNRNEVSMWDF